MNGDRMMIQDLARRVRALEDRLSTPEDAPKPSTLREQVADYLRREVEAVDESDGQHLEWADAVLAVVADWLAAQPMYHTRYLVATNAETAVEQRDHDVRLLRGVAS